METSNSLSAILDALKQSPLAQLSLSSRELFHSNFLAWLCESYPSLGCALFGRFVPGKPDRISKDESLKVERESKNIDLWLHFPSGEQLVIENKVKSIATEAQLAEYSLKVGSPHTSFLLLSLSRPLFLRSADSHYTDKNRQHWHYWSYADLGKYLSDVLSSAGENLAASTYHRQIIEDYIEYVTALHKLNSHYSIDEHTTDCFFQAIGDDSPAHKRFYSGVRKMRYAQLAGVLDHKLQSRKFTTLCDESSFWKEGGLGSVFIYSGMSRGSGLLGFKVLLFGSEETPSSLALGVQLQNKDFRLVVACRNSGAKRAAEILNDGTAAQHQWFDFSHLKLPADEQEFPAKDKFNKFGEIFYYRYKRLQTDIAPRAIVEAFVTYAELIRSNSQALREKLIASL